MPPTDDAAGSADGSVDGGLTAGHPFLTVFGRGLVGELPNIAHPPYLVVTMADLWPMFEPALAGHDLAGVHLVESIEIDRLDSLLDSGLDAVPAASSVIGLGGGQAIDVAKYVSWRRRLPLFQVPTALTVNAPWGHRAGRTAVSQGHWPRRDRPQSRRSPCGRRRVTGSRTPTIARCRPGFQPRPLA